MVAVVRWQRWGRLSPEKGERAEVYCLLMELAASQTPYEGVWATGEFITVTAALVTDEDMNLNTERESGRRTGPSEQPWHSGTINGVLLCCTVYSFGFCALIHGCIYAHYASCHPATGFITQDYNGTSHSFLFCLTREHNWISFVYWAFLNTLPPHSCANAQIRDLQTVWRAVFCWRFLK